MSNLRQTSSFTCDLCEKHREGLLPYEATLRIGIHVKQFHLCKECFAATGTNAHEQDLNIFRRAWNKFFGGK